MIYEEYKNEIREFKDVHKGDRCFIIATGPSIKKISDKLLNKLNDEILIGVNAAYMINRRLNIKFDYYGTSCIGYMKLDNKEFLDMYTNLFITGKPISEYLANRKEFNRLKKFNIFILKHLDGIRTTNGWINQDLSKGVQGCISVVPELALPISYYIGCKEVYLLGVEYNPSNRWYHFFDKKGYRPRKSRERGKGYWDAQLREYKLINDVFKSDNRKIYNTTIGSKLGIFDRVNLEDIL